MRISEWGMGISLTKSFFEGSKFSLVINFDGFVKSQESSHSREGMNPVVSSIYGFLPSQE